MFRNSVRKIVFTLTSLIAIPALLLTGCGDDATSVASSEEKPLIVVTTTILGDVVSNMVGDNFQVEVIMLPGADPHDFQASARQVAKIMEADLLIVNGWNFEEGLLDVIEAAEEDGVKVFKAISVVNQLEGDDDHDDHEGHDDHDDHEGHDDEEGHDGQDDHEGHDGHDDHEGHDDHDHGGVDPHFFTDPARMAQVVEKLAEFLVAEFPEVDESSLVTAATNYKEQLEDLDDEVAELLSAIPVDSRLLVTNHSVFAYFAERYQFEVLGSIIPSSSTLSNASAQQIASLAEVLRSNGVTAIFVDASSSGALAEALAGEVDDVKVINLYSESLGDPDSEGATYIGMVRFNAEAIRIALLG